MRHSTSMSLWVSAVVLTGCPGDPLPADAGSDPSLVEVRFDPEGEGFYRMPWPSDARLTPAGTPDLSDYPNVTRIFQPTLSEIEREVRGFATMPVVYIALTNSVTEASLPQGLDAMSADSPIQLIDLSETGCGRRLPLEIAFAEDGDELRDDHMLQVANAIGTVLTPGHPYGLVILNHFGAAEGRSTPRPPAFDQALRDTEGADALSRSLAPLRDCDFGLALDEIAVATVFTPQDPVADMALLRDFVMDPDRLETRPVTDWRLNDSWSRRRLDIESYTATVQMPIFQNGTTPYTEEGGALVFDGSGQPVVQRWEPVDIVVAVGTGSSATAGPRPVLVFQDGTGWRPWGHLNDNWVRLAREAGFVVASFMPQFHGGRGGVTDNTEALTFNVANPAAVRTHFRQQAAETSYFIRLLREQIDGLAGLPELDTEHIVYGGHSQGALVGALTAAVEDQYLAYGLNGLSSFLTLTILFREDILDFGAVVSLLYGYRGELDRWNPLLQLLQLGAEAVDPHNYVSRWRGWSGNPGGANVFVVNGYEDATTTPRGMEHLTMTADLPPISPPGWDVDPVGVWETDPVGLPVSGNVTALSGEALTQATLLRSEYGHGTIYRQALARELSVELWNTADQDPPSLSSEMEYQCGDGADEDQDGATDCDDEDCATVAPCTETRCDDGLDDDDNGLVDCADTACDDDDACRESECGDGRDDDDDGLTDCADDDCAALAPCAESRCDDGADDDDDGAIDCADTDCAGTRACAEDCDNGEDDDLDGRTDCEDTDCRPGLACPESSCSDGEDDDLDGLADCLDPDCAAADSCAPSGTEDDCADGRDGDDDGLIDCEDADCALAPMCTETTCAEGDLGSQTGTRLWTGSLEGRDDRFPPGDCIAFGTGGDVPDISFRWTAPAAGEYLISTQGSSVDTVLSVLDPSCDPVRELACDDDGGGRQSSAVTVTTSEGESIVIVIGAYSNARAAGTVELHVSPLP